MQLESGRNNAETQRTQRFAEKIQAIGRHRLVKLIEPVNLSALLRVLCVSAFVGFKLMGLPRFQF